MRTVVLALSLLVASPILADEPWEGRPFAGDPQALLAAAKSIQPKDGEGVVILLDEARYTFNDKGLATRSERLVFRVVDEASVEAWASIEAAWSPWYEERPTVEGRVITASGSVHQLDPKSFSTADIAEDPNIFSDTRLLRGPLPAVAAGSLVEQVVTYRERNPLSEAGVSRRHSFGRFVETRRARLILEYPSSLAINVVSKTSVEPLRAAADGMVTVTYEMERLPAVDVSEWNTPADVSVQPYIAFSTGKSWQDVARRYSEIVDRQITAGPPPSATRKAGEDVHQTAARFLDGISRQIRYAGVEFGEGSIVPRPPSTTLQHKYGDCKDKATLLVAMLRRAGIPAHVALIVSGSGPDVDPGLPGLGHFDHVIVYVPGPSPIWIDPTDEFARAGELPDQDQDRYALVASPDSVALLRTPAGDAQANTTTETREFVLMEDGKSKVVETSVYRGSNERALRRTYAETEAKVIREQLESYVKQNYIAEELGKYETSDPRDLTKPFRIRLEAVRSARGITAGGEAAVGMLMSRLLDDMPWALLMDGAEEDEPKTRAHDFVFPMPHLVEIQYRITLPPGYVTRELPENETVALGAMTITKQYVQSPDGTVVATHRMDTGPRRITPAQFEETKTKLQEIRKSPVQLLHFDQLGAKLMVAGKIGEAITEYRRMAALHPKEGLHRSEIARALLAGGMGSAARREAKRAVDMDPASARVHHNLGVVLAHDLIGRQFGRGFDLDGALAAYRKAKELAPKDLAIRAELATVLQRNAAGEAYGNGADLNAAIAEYLDLKKLEFPDLAVIDRELMVLYARTGRFAELKKLTESTSDTEKRDVFAVVAAAGLNGPAAGVRASESVELAKRQITQATAAGALAIIRRYPEAAALMDRAASASPNAAQLRDQADLMRKIKRHEDLVLAPGDPRDVLRGFLSAGLSDPTEEKLKEFFTADVTTVFDGRSLSDTIDGSGPRGSAARRKAMRDGMKSFIVDAVLAGIQIQQEGSEETGYRLLARAPGTTDMTTFVVRENEKYRIAAMSFAPEMLGLQALRLVDAGKRDIARQWLDWARDYVRTGSGDDPVLSNPFAALWTRGQDADEDAIRLAAAVLLPDTKGSSEVAIPLLAGQRDKVPTEQQWRVDQALATAYRAARKWDDALVASDRLLARHPASAAAFVWSTSALVNLDRVEEAGKRAQARLAAMPDDDNALRVLGDTALRRGDYATGREYYAKVLKSSRVRAGDYNQYAWMAAFQSGANLEEAIEQARQGVALSPDNSAIMHTLALLYAETGQSAEARDALLRSMDAASRDEPAGHDWYVLGRIGENYGITDEAIEAYKRVTKPEETFGSTWELAQRRLKALRRSGS
jgi:tetratricopeptide (TPR) repeat protein/transglutaminase-like putative cysteine protease